MERVKIKFPEKIIYSIRMNIRVSDLNYGGHVGNDVFLSLAHEARLQYFQSKGFQNEKNGPDGTGIIIADAAIIYKKELFHGDEITIDLAIGSQGSYGFDLLYRISKEDAGIAALIKTGVLFYDYNIKKMKPIPEGFIR